MATAIMSARFNREDAIPTAAAAEDDEVRQQTVRHDRAKERHVREWAHQKVHQIGCTRVSKVPHRRSTQSRHEITPDR